MRPNRLNNSVNAPVRVSRFARLGRILALTLAALVLAAPPAGALPRPKKAKVLVSAPVTTAAFQRISASYIDPSRFDFEQGLDEALRSMEALIPEFQADYKPGDTVLKAQMNLARKTFNVSYLSSIPATLDILKKVYIFVEENLESDVDLHEVEYTAVNGFMNILDPHSRLLAPDIYREFMVTTSGSFGGIGIVVGVRDNKLTVISPLDDTPAARAGMQAGDQIIRIEDESTENMPLDEAVKRLRGPEGTDVNMTIQREGEAKPLEVSLTRARIEIKSVNYELLPGNVGYVRLTSFQENTARDLKDALATMQGEVAGVDKFEGLVLDLRNNPGGLLDQAIQVSDLFLEKGDIVSTVTRVNRKPERAHHFRTEPEYPIVVLVNEGSASASEIVSGALKNHGRAVVIGNRTFGKGSVQNLFELPMGAALKLTVAQYLTPGDQSIQSVGVAPDILLRPIMVSDEEIRMSESSRRREEKQDYHIEGIKTASARERYKLSYLIERQSRSDKEAEREAIEDEYNNRKKIDLDADYPVDLARRLVMSAPDWRREAFYKASQELLEKEETEQSLLITQSLAKRNLDWSACETTGNVVLKTKVTVLDENKKPEKVADAGAEHYLKLAVKNAGASTVCRLRAVTESDIPFLDRREFVLGTLAPGESTQQMIPFKLGKSSLGRTSDVEFTFVADAGKEVHAMAAPVSLRGGEPPNFAVSYELVDSPDGLAAQGNGNGLIEPGETIGLKITLKNVGDGRSESSTMRIRTMGGALVEIPEGRGNHKFKSIEPGEETQATLHVKLKPEYLDSTLGLEFSVWDNEYGTGLLRKLELAVARDGAKGLSAAEIEKARGQTFAPPVVEVDGVGLTGLSSDSDEITLVGELRDDVRVKDFYLAINGEKIYYRSYDAAAAERFDRFRFNTKVPLEPGSNFVLIVTRDNDDLSTRYPLYVWSTLPKPVEEAVAEDERNLQASRGDPVIRSESADDGTHRVLVHPFVAVTGGDEELAGKLTDLFMAKSRKAQCAQTISRQRIADALTRMGMNTGCVAQACQVNVAREVKADVLVRGELTRAGDVYVFSVVVSDLASGRVLLSDRVLAGKSELVKRAESLAARVGDVIPCR